MRVCCVRSNKRMFRIRKWLQLWHNQIVQDCVYENTAGELNTIGEILLPHMLTASKQRMQCICSHVAKARHSSIIFINLYIKLGKMFLVPLSSAPRTKPCHKDTCHLGLVSSNLLSITSSNNCYKLLKSMLLIG